MRNQTSILIVEDDLKLSQLMKEYLSELGFMVSTESNGSKAIYRIQQESPNLVILDINLPDADGFQICRTIRDEYNGLILMLTARESIDDHISGLDIGADDYIQKPIKPDLLHARIKTLLKRNTGNFLTTIEHGQLKIDVPARKVYLNNFLIDLKPKEVELLIYLAKNADMPVSRDSISKAMRGISFDGIDRSIDLRISYLRKSLQDDPEDPKRIITVRGKGYCFVSTAWE